MSDITTLLFDVGGVILTNGWSHELREKAAQHFQYDYDSVEEHHQRLATPFECGQLSIDDYLSQTVFDQARSFTKANFIRFMEEQSQPHPHSLEVLQRLVDQDKYQLATVNNESMHLNLYRIRTYELTRYFSAFFSSCFLGVTKPHCEIFQKTLHILQKSGDECLFIDDREENAEAAQQCGINAVHLPRPGDLEKVLRGKGVLV
ncbi:MAG: HAD-IA family hydrolase [Tunicatimonas sp.]